MPSYLLNTPTAKKSPQSQPIPGRKDMIQNAAGGFVFRADSWHRFERFLILGSEGATYYTSQKELTKQNVDNVRACIATDGVRAVKTIVDISVAGRAPKNDPALYALALAASYGNDVRVRQAALEAMPKVARTGTHLFQFAAFIDSMRGWGLALRRAVAAWYLNKPADKLAYAMVKYQQRDGWSHADLLRLSHPNPPGSSHKDLFRWALGKEDANVADIPLLCAFEDLKKNATETNACNLIREYGLTREMIPTELQKSPKVWEALLCKMPLTAMIRTLGRMSACGLLAPMSDASMDIAARLRQGDEIRKARVHPIHVLAALCTYQQGHGERGKLAWTPVPQVVDALDEAFYLAFHNVEPTGKRFYLGVDVSGSMGSGTISGVPGLTPRQGAAAMAMLTAKTEENWYAAGFSDGSRVKDAVRGQTMHAYWGSRYIPSMERLPISKNQRLDQVVKLMEDVPMGGTDCALPMLDALHQNIPVDCSMIYTDNETWAGSIHPKQALDQYRQKMGIYAKCIVVGMTATECSIADPTDAGMMDVVGFDASVPAVIADFVGGNRAVAAEDAE